MRYHHLLCLNNTASWQSWKNSWAKWMSVRNGWKEFRLSLSDFVNQFLPPLALVVLRRIGELKIGLNKGNPLTVKRAKYLLAGKRLALEM